MQPRDKTVHFSFANFLTSSACSFLLIGALWLICAGLQTIGLPFPKIEIGKFSDLSFFALSNFSFITFLSMIPFQTAEGKLSPGFYARIVNRQWSHFGLYILMSCFVACYLVLGFYQNHFSEKLLSQLFFAIIASIIFALIFHRIHTLRYLHQPMIVYENLAQLAEEESLEELWLDLYECTLKAIKENRVSDARSFCNLMAILYSKIKVKEKKIGWEKDLHSLYQAAKDQHPIASQIEKNWSSLALSWKT